MTRTRSSLARWRAKLVTIGVAVAAMAAALLTPGAANAAVDNPAPGPLVSFTFDDGALSALTQAAPTLQKHGLTGTNYVTTDCVGMTTVPNTCRANTDVPYMTWDQILQLQNTYGWEIGSHTVTHQCLVSVGDDCQATKLTRRPGRRRAGKQQVRPGRARHQRDGVRPAVRRLRHAGDCPGGQVLQLHARLRRHGQQHLAARRLPAAQRPGPGGDHAGGDAEGEGRRGDRQQELGRVHLPRHPAESEPGPGRLPVRHRRARRARRLCEDQGGGRRRSRTSTSVQGPRDGFAEHDAQPHVQQRDSATAGEPMPRRPSRPMPATTAASRTPRGP